MHPLVALLAKPTKRVVGLMSGTSIDGIDAALCDITGAGADATVNLVDFRSTPYTDDQRRQIHALLQGDAATLCQGSFRLGEWLAQAAREVAGAQAIDLIGSHGQTVWHHDGVEPSGAATLQLGDGDFVAEACGAAVVSDFRQRDIAAGGEGAPLSALADDLVFAAVPRPCAILNLGGMANLTILRPEPHGPVGGVLGCLGVDADPVAHGELDVAAVEHVEGVQFQLFPGIHAGRAPPG